MDESGRSPDSEILRGALRGDLVPRTDAKPELQQTVLAMAT